MKYMFAQDNNGYCVDHIPIDIDRELSQEEADKIMLDIPGARRVGIGLDRFIEECEKHGIIVKKLEQICIEDKFYGTINNISGNY